MPFDADTHALNLLTLTVGLLNERLGVRILEPLLGIQAVKELRIAEAFGLQ